MRRLLGVLAVCAAALLPAAALAAPALATLPDATLTNIQVNRPMQFHGIGNYVTVGDNASVMHQQGCTAVIWFGHPQTVCEWANASGLCLDTDSTGLNVAHACTGSTVQLWLTVPVTGQSGQYWLENDHWSGVAGTTQYDTANFNGVGSTISANVGAGHGNFAVWGCC